MPTTRQLWTLAWRRYRQQKRRITGLHATSLGVHARLNWDLTQVGMHLPEPGQRLLERVSLVDQLRQRKAAYLREEAIHRLDLAASMRLHPGVRHGPLVPQLRQYARDILAESRVYREQSARSLRLLP